LSVAAGLLVGAILVPFTGIFSVAVRDASNTFLTLKVPKLGKVPSRSEILDSQGKLIAYYYPDHKYRIPVSYNYIAPVMRNAIVAIEDSRFYHHGALDPRGTLRAVVNDLEHKNIQGGSDLAQQYIKNALVLTAPNAQAAAADAAPNIERKIRELRMAADVEHELTPDQLLAAYLNVAYFENSAYGIQVAAERYFNTTSHQLTLPEAAMLAGMVENPTADDPMTQAAQAKSRRNVVLARMAQLGYITKQRAAAVEKTGLGLHTSTIPLQTGCESNSAANEAFFCDYALAVLRVDPFYSKVWNELNTTGGLKIYTTMDERDQQAATRAVNYVQPAWGGMYNNNHDADVEVLIQPGTGRIRAIAENRRYGTGRGQTTVDYAVDEKYDGGLGVQQGSSAKLFTLLTALKQGIPFGFSMHVSAPANLGPYYSCRGQPSYFNGLMNAEGPGKGTFTLYNGTTQSINVFFAQLEDKVGLCNDVKTAVSLGVHRATGGSLLRRGGGMPPADDLPSFTLGSGADIAPMTMADAYATVAGRGIYCRPMAISSIATAGGKHLAVESAGCHRVLSAAVADAATHILQGVITSGTAASPSRAIGRPAAAKTGTGNDGDYTAFGGYTPSLAGYVSVFNPDDPTTNNDFITGRMIPPHDCYRETYGGLSCPGGQMFGDDAAGATWQLTFLHAALGPPIGFVPVPVDSPFYSSGDGVNSPKPPSKKGGGGGNGGHGGGGGGNGGGPPHPHF
jgi:membrane peptidoglycan carboxypeptidase